jgi:hypothetical protein
MRADLTAFLRRAAGEPFRFGEWDCAMTLANWVREVSGEDPAPMLRGRYRTRLGWMRIVKREGGLVALVGALAFGAGMKPTDRPAPGDVGVVEVPGVGHAGAIRTARGWAVKLDDGIVAGEMPWLAAWSF